MKKALLFAFVLFWASWVSAREPAILLAPPEDSDFRTWRAELRASGIVLRHAFPPAGGIAFEEETLEIAALELLTPPGTQVWRSSPEGEEAQPIRSTREGDLLWHAHRALLGLEGPFSLPTDPPGEAPENDALAPPHFRPEVACSAASLLKSPAEYMLGSISVTVILPESTGVGSENWTSTYETNVSNEITQGCDDLSNYYNRVAGLRPTWTYHHIFGRTDARAQIAVEPISNAHPSSSSCSWVDTIYTNLGYADSGCIEKGRHHGGDVRTSDGTDWAFDIFVANSVADSDGLFSDSYFAYAYLGGPFEVQTYDNDGWGIGQMNKVTRHETSHIFYALDEYSSSGCQCTDSSGYVSYPDQNCNRSCATNVDCIMNEASRQQNVCTYTAGQIGWGDSDSDTIPDPVDIEPLTALAAYAPDPTANNVLTYTGTASIQAKTNQNVYNYRCDQNILTIVNVQWRVDGGAWSGATASDGSFNGKSEGYTFTTGLLANGTHTVETRAVDELGQVDSTPASDTVTVNAPVNPPGVPSGATGTALRSSKSGSNISVTWDVATCSGASNHTLVFGKGTQIPSAYGGTYALTGAQCNIGTSGSYSWSASPDPADNAKRFYWWLVVAHNGAGAEGSWGKNSGGNERTGPGTGGCSGYCSSTSKSTANTCGTP